MSVETDSPADSDQTAEELAQKLGEAITEMPAYQTFQEKKEAVEADETAQEQIEEFEQIREEYMMARQTGQADQEDLRQLQEAQEKLHSIPVMSEFLQAQNDLELRLQALNEHVSDPLAVDFGEKAGGCCND
ncbi:YlbF family regulator [Salinibaculum rarum]|uniref:YlbF family regulator n=1 Tax=Salinibaculum rarum TaxID=3058903 RepID=UPI00265D8D50|nr:YlbF family regulator [Salinibaculum sp. KK48]